MVRNIKIPIEMILFLSLFFSVNAVTAFTSPHNGNVLAYPTLMKANNAFSRTTWTSRQKGNIFSSATEAETSKASGAVDGKITNNDEECVIPEELSETEQLMQQVKDAGIAGVISYAAWELAFWTLSVPVCVLGYRQVTGHWPNLSDQDDISKLGAEAFAFVNFARFAVPLRIGLALGTTPWVQDNIVDRFMKEEEDESVCAKVVDESSLLDEDLVVEMPVDESLSRSPSSDESSTETKGKKKRFSRIFSTIRSLAKRVKNMRG